MSTFNQLQPGARFVSMEGKGASDHEFVKLAQSRATASTFKNNCDCGMTPGYTWNTVNEAGNLVHFCNDVKVRQVA